jgi:hypothetical protein
MPFLLKGLTESPKQTLFIKILWRVPERQTKAEKDSKRRVSLSAVGLKKLFSLFKNGFYKNLIYKK